MKNETALAAKQEELEKKEELGKRLESKLKQYLSQNLGLVQQLTQITQKCAAPPQQNDYYQYKAFPLANKATALPTPKLSEISAGFERRCINLAVDRLTTYNEGEGSESKTAQSHRKLTM